MNRLFRAALVLASLCPWPVLAASTISPTIPVQGGAFASAPIREQFQKAIADIIALQNMHKGTFGPPSPQIGQLWRDTNGSPTPLKMWDGNQWITWLSLDSTTHQLSGQFTGLTLSGALTYGGVTLNGVVTGTGNLVAATSPTLTTPNIGAATGTSLALSGAISGTAASITGLTVTGAANSTASLTSPGPTDWTSHLVYDQMRVVVNGFPINAEFGNNTVPIATALMGGILVPANAAGAAAGQAVAGYAITYSQTVGAVGVMGVGLIGVNNGTAAWQFNGITSNAPCPQPGIGWCAAESGFDSPYLFGWEGDFNIAYKAGHVIPTTALDAILLTGGSTVQPSAGSNAFHLGLLGVTIDLPWTRGFLLDNGATLTAFETGTLAVSGASGSQPFIFRSRDGSAVVRNSTISANSDGDFLLTAGSGLITASRTNITYSDTNFNGATISNSAVNAQAWGRLDIRTAAFSGLILAQLGTSGNVRIWNQDNTTLSFGTNNADVLTLSGTGATFAAALVVTGTFKVTQASPTAAAACSAGQIAADTGFIYTCSASGAWKRVAVTGGY